MSLFIHKKYPTKHNHPLVYSRTIAAPATIAAIETPNNPPRPPRLVSGLDPGAAFEEVSVGSVSAPPVFVSVGWCTNVSGATTLTPTYNELSPVAIVIFAVEVIGEVALIDHARPVTVKSPCVKVALTSVRTSMGNNR